MITTASEEQILKLFQSLFSRDQLRKNLYFYQHLQPDMTLKIKVICNERKMASITRDPQLILQCLAQCPLVELINQDTLRLKVPGDALVVSVQGVPTETRKTLLPLLKDIKNQVRETSEGIEIEFQSETSVSEFLQRLKAKGVVLPWKLKQKDPYSCIQKSVKFLLKQRKNHQQSINTPYQPNNNYYPQQYYAQQYYPQYTNTQQQQQYQQYQQQQQQYPYQQQYQYQTFIRKAVDSEEDQEQEEKQVVGQGGEVLTVKNQKDMEKKDIEKKEKNNQKKEREQVQGDKKKNKSESTKQARNHPKFDAQDFPQL